MNKFSDVAVLGVFGRKISRLLLAAGVVAALAAAIGAGGGARAAAAPSAPSGAGPASFSGLSCKSASFCLATGIYHKPGGPYTPLLEAWNGRTWRTFPKPPYYHYYNITCGARTFCLAATLPPKHKPSTVVWNGRTWRTFKPQPPDPYDVTCPSATFCVTYDSYGFVGLDGTSIVNWTGGTSWHGMPDAGTGCGGPWCSYSLLSCATASICFDQGSYCTDDNCTSQIEFSETWNGTTWGQPNGIGAVPYQACAGRSFCMTLNLAATPPARISRDWGVSWHDASAGLAAACHLAGCAQLDAFACGSPYSCVALTSKSQTAAPADALIWNGVTWKTARIARVAGHLPTLTLLSCGSKNDCAAIGTYQPTTSRQTQPIAEHWNGSAWKITPIPSTP